MGNTDRQDIFFISKEIERLIPSEKVFQQAIAGLLARMPGIENVQILHGAQEYGKDITFRTKGPLGESHYCACVLKKDKITGSASSKNGSREVFHQAGQALDTPLVSDSGEQVHTSMVYVMSPFPVSAQAMNAILGALNKRSGQIVFLSGAELVRLFKQHWPSFFADESEAIERILRRYREILVHQPELDKLASLYNLASVKKTSDFIYVDLDFVIHFYNLDIKRMIDNVLPGPAKMRSDRWASNDVEQFRSRFRSINDAAKYLHQCRLWDTDRSKLPKKVLSAAAEFLDLYPVVWREYAIQNIGKDGKMPKLIEGARIRLSRVDQMIFLLSQVKRWFEAGIRPLLELGEEYIETVTSIPCENDINTILSGNRLRNAFLFNFCVTFSPILKESVEQLSKVDCRNNLLAYTNSSLLIVGPAGSGKTTFCRWHALQDTECFLEGKSTIVPVFMQLHKVQNDMLHDFEQLLDSAVRHSALMEESTVSFLNKEGHIVRVYMDGLDEIYHEEDRRRILTIAESAIKTYRNLQIVATARDYLSSPSLFWLPRLELKAIGPAQIELLASKWLGEAACRRFMGQLQSLFGQSNMVWTPLLATLTIMVFKMTSRLPESKTRLYYMFVDLLCGGWDFAKGILRVSSFVRDVKIQVLAKLAYEVHLEGKKYFSEGHLEKACKWTLPHASDAKIEALKIEMLNDGVIRTEASDIQFRHLSFQEYLAAHYLLRQPRDRRLKNIIRDFVGGNDWWMDVIKFYVGMYGNPTEFMKWLEGYYPAARKDDFMTFYKEAMGYLGDICDKDESLVEY